MRDKGLDKAISDLNRVHRGRMNAAREGTAAVAAPWGALGREIVAANERAIAQLDKVQADKMAAAKGKR